VKGILADVHMGAFVEALVREMQSEYWSDYWTQIGLDLYRFEDVGLTPTSTDLGDLALLSGRTIGSYYEQSQCRFGRFA
jgi:hypothetical protein